MAGRALNVIGAQQLVGADVNKTLNSAEGYSEGVYGATLPELELSMDDEELLSLSSRWETQYFNYEGGLKKRQETAKKYWLGQQNVNLTADSRPVYDNLIFQSVETFLPQATSQNPVSVSNAGPDPVAVQFAKNIDAMNASNADRLGLRYILKDMTRHWSLFFLGVIKVGWDDEDTKNVTLEHVHSQRIMIDPDSVIDFKGRPKGRWVGERKTVTAQQLSEMFPKAKDEIKQSVNGLLGTNVTYTEWWTPEYCFYTYKKTILQKMKNPHWNWDEEKKEETESQYLDEQEISEDKLPNHFSHPQVPYLFLKAFNMGEHPHDDTSLLEQNERAQDLIQERNDQITANVMAMNNSLAFAGPQFTREQAKQGNKAVNAGQGIFVPNGPISGGVQRLSPNPIPNQVFDQLKDVRNEMQNVWGVRGLSPSGQEETETVRGRMQNQQYDSSRIGGTITEGIEQVADSVFNWFNQLYCVYYTTEETVSIIGMDKGVQQAKLKQSDFLDKAVITTVVPNSMLPKDPITKSNQAMSLWEAGALDPISLFTALDFPDPVSQAEKVFLWKTNPMALFPNLQQQQQAPQSSPGAPQGAGAAPEQQGGPTPTPQSPTLPANAPPIGQA
jgi:hypothetical protein